MTQALLGCDGKIKSFAVVNRRKRNLRRLYDIKGYDLRPNADIVGTHAMRLEYLYHNVGYQSIIIKLCSEGTGFIIIDAEADYVELEWIEK